MSNDHDELEEALPGLRDSEFQVTSDRTGDYNCVAWACLDDDLWWSHAEGADYHWPNDVAREPTIDAYRSAFASVGFEPCAVGDLVEGVEKIAIFGNARRFTHAARQLQNGRWTSKLGGDCDIEHELRALEARDDTDPDYDYGFVAGFMQRPRPVDPDQPPKQQGE